MRNKTKAKIAGIALGVATLGGGGFAFLNNPAPKAVLDPTPIRNIAKHRKYFPVPDGARCKLMARQADDGCNVLTYEICTDGKDEWDTGYKAKTIDPNCEIHRNKKNVRKRDPANWK